MGYLYIEYYDNGDGKNLKSVSIHSDLSDLNYKRGVESITEYIRGVITENGYFWSAYDKYIIIDIHFDFEAFGYHRSLNSLYLLIKSAYRELKLRELGI